MDARGRFATAISLMAGWGLRRLGRQGSNLPGRIGLKLDSKLLDKLASLIRIGTIVTCGTNGKTTTNNLICKALQQEGYSVACNSEGANMRPGVTAALARAAGAGCSRRIDWACLEVDEFSAPAILAAVKPKYLVLLNLFRDQLDRYGEIDIVIDRLVAALDASPATTVIYNADDPLAAHVADHAAAKLSFGVDEDMHLPGDLVVEGRFCMRCGHVLDYDYRQYGQLGDWHCVCGNRRGPLDYRAHGVEFAASQGEKTSFWVSGGCDSRAGADGGDSGGDATSASPTKDIRLETVQNGAYMVYNITAAWAAADRAGVDSYAFKRMLDGFVTNKGRMESFTLQGVPVTVNLAKNPTGFNQNIGVTMADERPKAVLFIVNSNANDGRDVSWLWDVDYERLAASGPAIWYAGGDRRCDLQVRLKYADIPARLSYDTAETVREAVERGAQSVYVLPNYSALVPARDAVAGIADSHAKLSANASENSPANAPAESSPALSALSVPSALSNSPAINSAAASPGATAVVPEGFAPRAKCPDVPAPGFSLERPLRIAHMYPELLNLYGDRGNVICLAKRCSWRKIPVQVVEYSLGDEVDFSECDIVFIGGGSDREEQLVCEELGRVRDSLCAYVEDDGVLLAVCGGYQLLGEGYLIGSERVKGLGVFDADTQKGEGRLVGNVAIDSPLCDGVIVGYENHAGRTTLGPCAEPLGRILAGYGNDGESGHEGAVYKNAVGTYLHGPLLPKNPALADWLIASALKRRLGRDVELEPLPDAEESAANEVALGLAKAQRG